MLPGHERLLEALRICRAEAIAAKRYHRPRSGMVRCLEAMVEELDAVAELITGDAKYFHERGARG
jgi:hypothetical protein